MSHVSKAQAVLDLVGDFIKIPSTTRGTYDVFETHDETDETDQTTF